ncbi:YeeE/YedE family protein [Micromonospora sp. DR5-3]|uniref:YeeE/YedE family protein n=1 Tax=unclassified Micromonospora TaxID=2617518 RepID=UPI0011D646E6|nr:MULTISPECIES: YeeE/YedE thiosulfate transporter family protein [unclassified Micromonospora]MCW3819828.1 YeeE/YedE family protein [Micromonospora sp. DR5-3]TYC20198.1 transporter [Micromonospora sp. MP36]
MTEYWPWWAGAAGLALTTINYAVTTDRSFGVSGAWDRVLHWRAERRVERVNAQFADERVLTEALVAATADQFGAGSAAPALHLDTRTPGQDARPPAAASSSLARLLPAPLVSQVALLLAVFVGGWVAAVTTGRFQLRLDMGDAFGQIVTDKPIAMIGTLFVGGVLVGFGTRLAGGCSSGHGLNGCGRLQPVSIVATAVFFGTGVLVSFLLWKVI